MVEKLKELEAQGLSGSIYTEPFDVEGEQNGLMTYDRAVITIAVAQIAKINSKLVPMAQNYGTATQGFSATDADLTPESQRFAALPAERSKGRSDLQFLRHFTLMAIRRLPRDQYFVYGVRACDGSRSTGRCDQSRQVQHINANLRDDRAN